MGGTGAGAGANALYTGTVITGTCAGTGMYTYHSGLADGCPCASTRHTPLFVKHFEGTPERFGMEAHDGEGTCGRDGTRWHSCLSRSFSYTILYLGLPFTLLAALIVRYYISVIYVESCTRGWDVG